MIRQTFSSSGAAIAAIRNMRLSGYKSFTFKISPAGVTVRACK